MLDVNALVALVDPGHVFHAATVHWFLNLGENEWLTCPITENGVVRIVSHPSYPAAIVSVAHAVKILSELRYVGNHRFVPDTISVSDPRHFAVEGIVSSRRLTDTYLVALAAAHDAAFVTLDGRLLKDGVASNGAQVVYLETGLPSD